MATEYEYWQHYATGAVWAVELRDGAVIGAVEIGRADVYEEILPYLAYRLTDAREVEQQRDDFRKIEGRRGA